MHLDARPVDHHRAVSVDDAGALVVGVVCGDKRAGLESQNVLERPLF